MLSIQLMKSTAQGKAEAILNRYRELKGHGQEAVSDQQSDWEVIAWLVQLLNCPLYSDLKGEVTFFRIAFPADGNGWMVKYNVDEMDKAVQNDVEVRPTY